MRICMCAYIYTYTPISLYACIPVYLYTYIPICMYVCVYIYNTQKETVTFVKAQSYFVKAAGWQRKHSEQSSESMARNGGPAMGKTDAPEAAP